MITEYNRNSSSKNKTPSRLSLQSFRHMFPCHTKQTNHFSFQTFATAGDTAIFDTAFPNIVFPDKVYDAIDRLINPEYSWDYGVYTVDCSQANTLQDWVFTFQGVDFRVPAKDYLLDIQLPNNKCVLAFSRVRDDYTLSKYVLGSPFLRNFCTTYSFTVEEVSIQLSKAL
ncbi:Peptidase A1 domain-containing protein [Aphelenchoides bicaudatus]|nr:Peptidase A1 domain-containing protein [Aphelenchoides bicaudatus]